MVETARHRIDGFRIVAPIGVGGSASVYRAVNETCGTQVAIKVLADNHSMVPRLRRRFLDQVELLAAVESPAIARVLEHGETDAGQPYLVLELADRGDLRHRLGEIHDRGMQAQPEDVIILARHLAVALEAVHQAGIVHRDVTPGNILIAAGSDPTADVSNRPGSGAVVLGSGERFLLADLGLAKDLTLRSGMTAGVGTRGFAAPEQLDDVNVVDRRADIYGATAVMHWFVRGTPMADRLDGFLQTGLATDPDERPATMTDWFDGLRRALNGRSGRSFAGPYLRPLVGVGVAAIAVVGIGVAVSAVLDRDDQGDSFVLQSEQGPSAEQDDAPADRSEPAAVDENGEFNPSDDAAVGTVGDDLTESPAPSPTSPSGDDGSPSTTTGNDGGDPDEDGATPPETTATTEEPVGTTDPAPAGPTTTQADQRPTTVAPTTAPPTTVAPTNAPTTTEPVTTTTADEFRFSPRAILNSPTDGAVINTDLLAAGLATYDDGLAHVELTIHLAGTNQYWHDGVGLSAGFVRFPVPISPAGGTQVSWSYVVPAGELEPGEYVVRAWARGIDGNGDPVSDIHRVTIAG